MARRVGAEVDLSRSAPGAHSSGVQRAATLCFVVVGIVHALPLVGWAGAERLESLYQVSIREANLEALMRHRALMLGIIGALLMAAARWTSLRNAAATAGLVSMVGYVALVVGLDEVNPALVRVAWIDVVAILLLGFALGVDRRRRHDSP